MAAPPPIARRLDAIDWAALARSLDERGHATTGPLLAAEECAALARLFDDDRRFRATIDMARYRLGEGCYRYFAAPLPPLVEALRRHAYRRLAPIADAWAARLGGERHPEELAAFLARCARRGQRRPTPLLLRYGPGGAAALEELDP
jgi:hypothetical protein